MFSPSRVKEVTSSAGSRTGHFPFRLKIFELFGFVLPLPLKNYEELYSETDAGVLSVAAADLPGPPRIGLPMGSLDKCAILTELQRELTRDGGEICGGTTRARYAPLVESRGRCSETPQ